MRAAVLVSGAEVVDLECEPGMYEDANFDGPLDPHPIASGHAAIASDFARVIAHGSDTGGCKWERAL